MTSLRTAARAAAVAVPVSGVLLAAPALAVPEGWSDPDPVNPLSALMVYLILPALVFGVVVLLASLPYLIHRQKAAPEVADSAVPAERPEESAD